MKKFITTLLLAVVSLGTTAMAGDFYIGGKVGFMHESRRSGSTNEFSLIPEIGYSFNDHWGVGGTIGYTYRNTDVPNTPDINLNMFNINPYARFTYFRTSNNLVQLFLDGSVGLGIGSTEQDGNKSKTAVTYEIGIKPGVALNITEHFSIVANLGFLGYHGANNAAKDGGEPEYGGIRFDSRNLTFGMYYTF